MLVPSVTSSPVDSNFVISEENQRERCHMSTEIVEL